MKSQRISQELVSEIVRERLEAAKREATPQRAAEDREAKQRHLQRIVEARAKLDTAKRDLVEALADAAQAGVPQRRAADAARITRVTLYRWLHPDTEAARERPKPAKPNRKIAPRDRDVRTMP